MCDDAKKKILNLSVCNHVALPPNLCSQHDGTIPRVCDEYIISSRSIPVWSESSVSDVKPIAHAPTLGSSSPVPRVQPKMITTDFLARLPKLWRNSALPSSNWYTVSVSNREYTPVDRRAPSSFP